MSSHEQRHVSHLVPALQLWILSLCPTIAFAAIYVMAFGKSLTGGAAHLGIVATTSLTFLLGNLLLVRVLARWIGAPWIGIATTSAWLLSATLFYGVVFIGLAAWGRVPTWHLVAAYRDQLGPLLRILDISPTLAGCVAFFAASACICIGVFLARGPWLALTARRNRANATIRSYVTGDLALALGLVLSLGLTVTVWSDRVFFSSTPTRDEPFHIAFADSTAGTNRVQSLIFEKMGDLRRQRADEDARNAYRVAASALQRNIVLITVDALRPDHMGVYGYTRNTTPFLSKLAENGTAKAVSGARAACAESACGLLSLLTGKQPHELLARNFGLVEVLGMYGYRRHLLLGGDHTNFYKLRDFYGPVEHYSDGGGALGAYVNDDYNVLERVKQLPKATAQPHFLFFHLMSVHGLGLRHPEHRTWAPEASLYNPMTRTTADGLQKATNFYDNGVKQADWVISQIYVTLREKGYVDDSSIMLVTSDHGESLGEHGIRTHAESLFDSVLRVPWIWVGQAPKRSGSNHVIHADFAPTVLAELNAPIPQHWSGTPLANIPSSRVTLHAQAPLAAAVASNGTDLKKLVHNFRTNSSVAYDLVRDPSELHGEPIKATNLKLQPLMDAIVKAGYAEFGASDD